MGALEARVHETKDNSGVKHWERIGALHPKRQEGERKQEAIKAATAACWEHLKPENHKVWETL